MARRRMFSMDIIDTDFFLDLPISSQNLYFHLALRADDDGFISSPKRIMAAVKGSDDDLRLLTAKGFLIPFDSGICVITHWRIHNYIQNDRYKPTIYKDEKKQLTTDSVGRYACIQDVSEMETQVRLGKVRLGKVSEDKDRKEKPLKQAFGEYANVHLTDIEHSKLLEEYGEAQTKAIIAKLGNYKEEKGKRYKSDMAAIRLWVLDSGKFKKIERPKVEKCPHCGETIIDGLCRNGDCPQWVKA